MMPFTIITNNIDSPLLFYDGGECEYFPLELKLADRRISVDVDPLAPGCREWRHYYQDQELNELACQLGWYYEFQMNIETAFASALKKRIYMQPFWRAGQEISVCYCYEEASYGHYKCWLIAAMSRNMAEDEYETRLENIKQYWLK